MNTDDVTAAQAEAFWASLSVEEQRVLCDMNARRHSPALIRNLANAGMLVWADESLTGRVVSAIEGDDHSGTNRMDRAPRLGLAPELVLIIDRQV